MRHAVTVFLGRLETVRVSGGVSLFVCDIAANEGRVAVFKDRLPGQHILAVLGAVVDCRVAAAVGMSLSVWRQ